MDREQKILVYRKKIAGVALAALSALGAWAIICQSNRQSTRTAFNSAFNTCIKDHPVNKIYDVYTDPNNIPCFQLALKSARDVSSEYQLANVLVGQGRFAEAKPYFEDVAGSSGMNTLTGIQAAARQMLEPGAMEKYKAQSERSTQAQSDLLALTTKHNAEDQEFLRLHAVVRGGRITRMSAANKSIWLEMRERHSKEEAVLYKIRDGS